MTPAEDEPSASSEPSLVGTSQEQHELTGELRLFSFGSNSLGQLSIGHIEDAHTPTTSILPYISSSSPSDITIITGGNHTLLISHPKNSIYSVGDNTFGQCAIPITPTQYVTSFTLLPPPTQTTSWTPIIGAGWQFTILLSSDSTLYACGNGPRGELGLGAHTTSSSSPTPIPSFPPLSTTIVKLSSSVEHTVALLSDGTIYGWGNGRKGQLGVLPIGEKYIFSPIKLQISLPDGFEVAGISAGREFSAFISRQGDVYVIGSDKWGVITKKPAVGYPGWKGFGAGWGAVYVLTAEGKVMAWGRGTHGQMPPEVMPELERIAVGSEHVIAIGKDGKLFAWGWGEHGNCGILGEGKGEVVRWKHEVQIDGLSGGSRIEGIAAGCATSWVWVKELE
ncbi:hypothetical protein TWF694_008913 [Orbilia ellipsospora]|uniref:RCC1-like domain-containing protein n=1 Tax=Orbilia ellipsospora TaxID=2528407 RepID=A0AAV9XDA3_9PEZI